MFKTYSSSSSLVITSRWFATSRLRAPVSVRLVYWSIPGGAKPAWCRHQMEIFSALLAICAGNHRSPVKSPAQRPVARSFDIFFDLRLNKRLSKQSWGWWFETLSCPLWRQCDEVNAMAADGQLPGQIIRSSANKLLLVTTEPWLPGCRISNSCAVVNWQKCQYSFQVSSKWFSK